MTDAAHQPAEFEGWAILELMGHRKRPGWVKEVELAGTKMLRVDIPVDGAEAGETVTEFYGGPAVYCLRPASKEVVLHAAGRYGADPRPVRPVEFREPEKKMPIGIDYSGDVDTAEQVEEVNLDDLDSEVPF